MGGSEGRWRGSDEAGPELAEQYDYNTVMLRWLLEYREKHRHYQLNIMLPISNYTTQTHLSVSSWSSSQSNKIDVE
jgi:hypothetical protein